MRYYQDRDDAGRELADALVDRDDFADAVVLGLPRGGVLVAAPVAERLAAPLDVLVVRKVGAPGSPEVAMGAVGEDGATVRVERVLRSLGVDDRVFDRAAAQARGEVRDRVARLRRGRDRVDLTGRVALVVDDGVATGATASIACAAARSLGARRVVLAVPVGPHDVEAAVPDADEVVCLDRPQGFMAVGSSYLDFTQTTDDEVRAALERSRGV